MLLVIGQLPDATHLVWGSCDEHMEEVLAEGRECGCLRFTIEEHSKVEGLECEACERQKEEVA